MAAEGLKKFGKYFLLDMIAQGGMAEIYRARMATLDGGGRLLAIKRIIGNYSENKEFVDMFKSEIKTTSGFTHPNIVQLYDYGEENGMLYIAMEIVDGKNLRQFMTRFAELKQAFPVEVSVFIMEQSAHGMGYAHGYKDKFSGKSLNIVHRDISPQNLLISYDGAVKVIDFGIAKAVTNNESTRAGVIKGKPSYLSPEQISGEVLDGRSDIFALGIVLWELLTGRKLFASDNDYGVLKLIENCQNSVKPPSLFNPKVPKELDAIVMKSLHKNRDQRYQTSEELQRALHKFLYQFAPEFNPADLAYYARDLFKNEIVEDRKRLLKLNEKVEQLLAAPPPPAEVPKPAPAAAAPVAAMPPAPPTKEESTIALAANVDARIAYEKAAAPAAAAASTSAATQTGLKVRTNGTGLSKRGPQKEATRSPMVAILAVMALAGGYYYYTTPQAPVAGTKPPGREVSSTGNGTLTVRGNVAAATIMVEGEKVGDALPATLSGLPVDKALTISVSSNGFKKALKIVTLKAGESQSIDMALDPEVNAGGQPSQLQSSAASVPVTLRIVVNPAGVGSLIRVNGSVIDTTGIVSIGSDRPTEIIVERDGFRTHKETITVKSTDVDARKEFAKEVVLQPAKFGYVSIKTTPSAEAVVTIDGVEEKWSTPVSRKRIPVGAYKIKLVNGLLGMEKEVSFTVTEDRFTNLEERLQVNTDGRAPGSK
ncbi:MAG: serine/threonine protein kinase [Deltaproteobacteria bacterium]|nr:serine/threonine protein kinase [Deltaproteobacteria bacterium]